MNVAANFLNMLSISDPKTEDRADNIAYFEDFIEGIQEIDNLIIIMFNDRSSVLMQFSENNNERTNLSIEFANEEEFIELIYGQYKFSRVNSEYRIYKSVEKLLKCESDYAELLQSGNLDELYEDEIEDIQHEMLNFLTLVQNCPPSWIFSSSLGLPDNSNF